MRDFLSCVPLKNAPLADPLYWTQAISSDSGPELAKMADLVLSALGDYASSSPSMPSRLALEINASCPNLSTPPPFYSPLSSLPTLLGPLLSALPEGVTLGLKLPPFVHVGQFGELLAFLESLKGDQQRKVRYLACCNTLGGALGFEREVAGGGLEKDKFAGMAGEGLHAIALGFVRPDLNPFPKPLSLVPSPARFSLVQSLTET